MKLPENISPSGYYRCRQQRPSPRQREDAAITAQITAAHQASRGTSGVPRIVEDLRAEGTRTSKRRCARLMRAEGLRGKKKHCRRPRTTDSRHAQPIAANLIAQRPAPTGPNQSWLTDITYLETAEGWLYLAAILDLWSRRIVGWACGPTLHASLVLAALHDALQRRSPPEGLLHHSDRGSQYVDDDFYSTSFNGVRVQIWSAISAYLLVAIAKQRLHLPQSFWEILQIVSIASMEQIPLPELLASIDTRLEHVDIPKQLEINYS